MRLDSNEDLAALLERNPHLKISRGMLGRADEKVAVSRPSPPEHFPTPRPRMNKTETEYLLTYLKPRIDAGEIVTCEHEAIKFRIGVEGERCWYTVDFYVVTRDGRVECHEVKGGHVWDDARVKFLAAARFYPARWVWARKLKGNWTVKAY